MSLRFIYIAIILNFSYGCIEFSLKADDSTVTVGRSIESSDKFKTKIIAVPVEQRQFAKAPSSCGETKLEFYNGERYIKVTGVFGKEQKLYSGANDAGLSVNVFFLNTSSDIVPKVPEEMCGFSVSQLELGNYILSIFRSVQYIKELLEKNHFPFVWPDKINGLVYSCRYSVYDKLQNHVVFEYSPDTGITMHSKNLHILTDVLDYDWHMKTLKKYANVQLNNEEFKITPLSKASDKKVNDFTLEGRFKKVIKSAYFSKSPKDSNTALDQTFQTFDSTDISKDVSDNLNANKVTLWSVVYDLRNRCVHYRSNDVLKPKFICIHDIERYIMTSTGLEDDHDNKNVSSNMVAHNEEL